MPRWCARSCITTACRQWREEMAQPVKARPGSKGAGTDLQTWPRVSSFIVGQKKKKLLLEMPEALTDRWALRGCCLLPAYESGPTCLPLLELDDACLLLVSR